MSTSASAPKETNAHVPKLAAVEPLLTKRFTAPIETCEVDDKKKLKKYRRLWAKWMSWYEHRPDEPNSIESQINQ